MRNQYIPRLIISIDKPENSQGTNSKNYIQFLESLELAGKSYLRAKGFEDNVEKRYFILDSSSENQILINKTIVFYNIESYIAMDNEGKADKFFTRATKSLGSIDITMDKPISGDFMKILDTQQYLAFN